MITNGVRDKRNHQPRLPLSHCDTLHVSDSLPLQRDAIFEWSLSGIIYVIYKSWF